MADDLLFSTLDVSPEVSSKSDLSSNPKTGDSSQPSDFKRIFSEQVKSARYYCQEFAPEAERRK